MVTDLTATDYEQPPTLRDLAKRALDDGAPCVTFTQTERIDRDAAMLVLLLHDAAVRDIGPLLANYTHSIKQQMTANYILTGETLESAPASETFRIMKNRGLKWAWTKVDIGGLESTLVSFMGADVCRGLVEKLGESNVVSIPARFKASLGL